MSDYTECSACGAPCLIVSAHRLVTALNKKLGTYCSVKCCPRCEG